MGEENKTLTFDKSLFVIYVTVLFYLSAFSFKSGYFSFYKIPASFIVLDFSSLISIAVPLIVSIVVLVNGLDLLFSFFPKKDSVVKKGFMVFAFLLPFSLVLILFFGLRNWKVYLWILVILLAIEFLLPAFCFRGQNLKYWEKYNKLWSKGISYTPKSDRSDFQFWVIDKFGRAFYNAFWILYFSSLLFGKYSQNMASEEILHNVIHTKPEMLVIDMRGNEMICKPFDRVKKTFGDDFFILKETDFSNFSIRSENIGQLKFESTLSK